MSQRDTLSVVRRTLKVFNGASNFDEALERLEWAFPELVFTFVKYGWGKDYIKVQAKNGRKPSATEPTP